MKEYKPIETKGYYVYCHITPDEMFYIGQSKQQPCRRMQTSNYQTTSLKPSFVYLTMLLVFLEYSLSFNLRDSKWQFIYPIQSLGVGSEKPSSLSVG